MEAKVSDGRERGSQGREGKPARRCVTEVASVDNSIHFFSSSRTSKKPMQCLPESCTSRWRGWSLYPQAPHSSGTQSRLRAAGCLLFRISSSLLPRKA